MGYFLVRRDATTDKRRVDEVRSVRIQDEVKQGVLGKFKTASCNGEVNEEWRKGKTKEKMAL